MTLYSLFCEYHPGMVEYNLTSDLESGDAKNQNLGPLILDDFSNNQHNESFDGEPPRYDNSSQKRKMV